LTPGSRVWIAAVIPIPPSPSYEGTEAHIARHGITMAEVESVCLYGAHEWAKWHDHPQRGARLYVQGVTPGGRPLLCVLVPWDVQEGVFAVVTARGR
jgi:hypothetical protein